MKVNKRGFTLIELLVVIAIIGLLSTLAVVALNSARAKSRDAKRVADVRQMQTALELYFVDRDEYPVGDADNSTILGFDVNCLDNVGFSSSCSDPYMGLVPASPTPPSGDQYLYSAFQSAGICITDVSETCVSYTIGFTIEGPTGSFTAPNCTANQDGITCSGTFN